MSYTYSHKKPSRMQDSVKSNIQTPDSGMPNAALSGLYGDASVLAAGNRPTDIPGALRSRMEESFGTDFSAVKFYENDALADAGAGAVAQGTNIVFAPGVLDFSTRSGQEVLGHELSHVVSRARGEVSGSGFLDNSSLEARADMEGRMAAAGEPVYGGAVTGALSPISASSAGPVQAWKLPWKKDKGAAAPAQEAAPVPEAAPAPAPTPAPTPAPRDPYSSQPPEQLSDEWDAFNPSQAGRVNTERTIGSYLQLANRSDSNKTRDDLYMRMAERYGGSEYRKDSYNSNLANTAGIRAGDSGQHGKNGVFNIQGLMPGRFAGTMRGSLGEDMTDDEIIDMYDKLMAPQKLGLSDEEAAAADAQQAVGMNQLKNVYLRHLRKMEKTYGAIGQFHPEDLIRMGDNRFYANMQILQDTEQLSKAYNMENSDDEEDREFARLSNYYFDVGLQMGSVSGPRGREENNITYNGMEKKDARKAERGNWRDVLVKMTGRDRGLVNAEAGIHGPRMDKKAYKAYLSDLKRRFKANNDKELLYGRFK